VARAAVRPRDPSAALDPRVVQTRARVLQATYRLLAEHGLAGATVEKVSDYSGVSRSTIYRHWPNPSELYLEALTSPETGSPYQGPSSGDLSADLHTYGQHLADRLNDPVYAAAFASLVAEAKRDPSYAAAQQRFISERSRELVRMIREAVRRGDLRADLDPKEAAHAFIGPFTYDCFLLQRRISRARARQLVDRALADWSPQRG
jgi:TetR/AcrR family transcriptional regulator, regulator of autoinduction and epiphytic fitness